MGEKISNIFDPKICTSRFKTRQSVPFGDLFFFWSTRPSPTSHESRRQDFQGCPVSVLLVGKVLNCLNREKKSYFFLSDRRFLNPLNHKKKSYFGFLGEKSYYRIFSQKKSYIEVYSKKQKKSFFRIFQKKTKKKKNLKKSYRRKKIKKSF